MFLKKYKYLLVALFMSIFVAKMGISGAPIFFNAVDQEILNNVIMQIELEHGQGKESGKETNPFSEFKLFGFSDQFSSYEFVVYEGLLLNDFIEHYGRYVDPHHPSVPTPPPNLV